MVEEDLRTGERTMSGLDDIRQREQAATKGPWEAADYVDIDADGSYDLANVIAPDPAEPETAVLGIALGILRKDAGFIAHARTDIPSLLGALDAVLALADKWAALGPADDWAEGGMADTVLADAGRAVRAAVNDALEADK